MSTLFDPVIGGPGSDYAANHRDWLLAEALPALTLPTGGSDGERFILFDDEVGALDMNANKNGWPSERDREDWMHSDIKDVAFPFTYKIFIELLQKGGLN